jgi:hypothetical protein
MSVLISVHSQKGKTQNKSQWNKFLSDKRTNSKQRANWQYEILFSLSSHSLRFTVETTRSLKQKMLYTWHLSSKMPTCKTEKFTIRLIRNQCHNLFHWSWIYEAVLKLRKENEVIYMSAELMRSFCPFHFSPKGEW